MNFRNFLVLLTAMVASHQTTAAQEAWQIIGKLSDPKHFYQMSEISSSEVLIMGGQGARDTWNSCDIVNVETMDVVPAASMNRNRTQFSAVKMPDGFIYAISGYSVYSSSEDPSVERYDIENDSWEVVGGIKVGRAQTAAVAISDYEILIVGGRRGSSNVLNVVEIYDTRSNESRRVADFPEITSFAKAFRLPNGDAIAWSGREGGPGSARSAKLYRYDVSENKWTTDGSNIGKLYYPTIVEMGESMWSAGGSWAETESGVDDFATDVCVFDGDFLVRGQLTVPRAGHGFNRFDDRTLIAVGGMGNDKKPTKTCELFDIETGSTWFGPSCEVGHGYALSAQLTRQGAPVTMVAGGVSDNGITDVVEVLIATCVPREQSANRDNFNLVGSAKHLESEFQLTSTGQWEAGAMWSKNKLNVTQPFQIDFSFSITEGSDNGLFDGGSEGADGIALVFQNVSNLIVGEAGRGIGYDKLPSGMAVEFDTYLNAAYSDNSASHVSVQRSAGGRLRAIHSEEFTVSEIVPILELAADGKRHFVRVVYDGENLTVFFNPEERREAILSLPVDILTLMGDASSSDAFVGITSATGFSVQNHFVHDFSIKSCNGLVVSINDDWSANNIAELVVYPNPADSRLTVKNPGNSGKEATIRIVNNLGETVLFLRSNEEEIDLEVSVLPAGFYVVHIETHANVRTANFVISR